MRDKVKGANNNSEIQDNKRGPPPFSFPENIGQFNGVTIALLINPTSFVIICNHVSI